ncbi:MAG TPA: addiction module protein [Gemmataceae bacterium]|jgi:putative addiction module component (TIGR02574 family)|nr:addiction module protein [Gemmataceae bacterium]
MKLSIQELGIDQMSAEDRIRLIGEIWDSLPSNGEFEMPESHQRELDRRLAAADAQPTKGSSWEEVRARLRGGQ